MLLIAGAAAVSALVTGYLAYGYSTNWRGAAYSLWCPKRRLSTRTVRSPFYGKIDHESKACVTEARLWMERYVRANLVSNHMKRKQRAGVVNANLKETTPRQDSVKSSISTSLAASDNLEVPSP